MRMDVALFGAAGYSGLELCKLLLDHPHVRLVAAASDTHAGKPIADFVGSAAGHGGKPAPTFVTTAQARGTKCDFAMLAVPPEAAKELANTDARVIDLSNAHRATHTYGLPSLFEKDIASAKLVANPGCYATCAILACAPLAALVDGHFAVSAGSGVTGAGKTASEEMSFGEMYGEVRAYKVLRHQHVPEIERAVGKRVVLTTHLLPVARGIFMTITAKLSKPLGDAYAVYKADPTVIVAKSPEDVSLRKVVGTNTCMIGAATDGDIIVVTAALDNLLKGAAGQAIENLNLMAGLPRLTGLEHLARHA